MTEQLTLLPEFDDVPEQAGIVYLMTDGLMLKFGYVSRPERLKQRKGELRAQIIGFVPGTTADEDAYLKHVEKWLIPGTEWFRLPHSPDDLYWLWCIAKHFGGWKGCPAPEMLSRVIAANLRQRQAS
jgi:hypothetical protein